MGVIEVTQCERGTKKEGDSVKIFKIFCSLLTILSFQFLYPDKQINQADAQADFEQTIISKAFDRYTGTLYVGTERPGDTTYDYSIASAGR